MYAEKLKVMSPEELKKLVRDVPDFPKSGIMFKDITPLLKDKHALRSIVDYFVDIFRGKTIHQVIGIESRGFILSPALAYQFGAGFVPVRKKGKLPAAKETVTYALEYGEDSLEIHKDAIGKGDQVIIVDDLLATGGTAAAAAELVERLGGVVLGTAFIIELSFLKGQDKIKKYPIYSLIQF
jgi:adenine phosphoribosyltransferase